MVSQCYGNSFCHLCRSLIFYQVIKVYETVLLPVGTSREEVKFLSMFYKNNLLNGFLFTIEREKCSPSLCECLLEDQTAFKFLTSCPKVDSDIRGEVILMLLLGNDVATADALIADNISLLNYSRDELFVQQCLKALRTSLLKLRSKITLRKRSHIWSTRAMI